MMNSDFENFEIISSYLKNKKPTYYLHPSTSVCSKNVFYFLVLINLNVTRKKVECIVNFNIQVIAKILSWSSLCDFKLPNKGMI